jgi:hypothetical protein
LFVRMRDSPVLHLKHHTLCMDIYLKRALFLLMEETVMDEYYYNYSYPRVQCRFSCHDPRKDRDPECCEECREECCEECREERCECECDRPWEWPWEFCFEAPCDCRCRESCCCW